MSFDNEYIHCTPRYYGRNVCFGEVGVSSTTILYCL